MSVPKVVLDTDNLSALMRKNPNVIAKATNYLAEHGHFTISIITRYEVLRGLLARGAIKQAAVFSEFCLRIRILDIDDLVIVKAAGIYADLYRRGELIGDADVLIAATAMVNDLAVATNNEGHFGRVRGLQVENWQK